MDTLENLHELGAELERLFLLRTSPLAIALVNRDQVPGDCLQPSKEGKHYALCQALAFSRRTRHPIAMFPEDHWCLWPVINFRLRELTEEDRRYLGTGYFIRDPEVSCAHFCREFPYIQPELQREGMVFAPLDRCSFMPQAILLYCDPSQLRQLLMAAKYHTGEIVSSSFDTCDSCGAALVPILNGEKHYNVSMPDAGEYERSLCGENEMIFALSRETLPDFLAAARELKEMGFGLRELSYDIRPDYARPEFYNHMFQKWGLETGEEWTPGQR